METKVLLFYSIIIFIDWTVWMFAVYVWSCGLFGELLRLLLPTDIPLLLKGLGFILTRPGLHRFWVYLMRALGFYEHASMSIFANTDWVYSEALARFGVQAQAVAMAVVK
ncbi:hypothetical protein M9H77_17497 [Catharanthus roseus]|uniref:Uncharacterized protein n=1 Tax=Catharanthus roseus TaxID=4058 RepID=A0ACC0B4T7_CATRO|nr:hypothetical protein M9H77_17497 [Catharanthus roseus]